MAKKRKRKKSYDDVVLGPVSTFATLGASIPVTYGMVGAAAKAPGASGATSNLSRHMGTGYNLMGIGGVTQSSMGLLRMMEHMNKKKKGRR